MFKRILGIILALAMLMNVAGCVERFIGEETVYSTGEVLTPEMIESIFEEISESVTDKYPTETMSNGQFLVYWLKGGSVWHASLNCGSLQKASPDSVFSGGISEALSAGKERGCKICSSSVDIDPDAYTEKLESEKTHEGITSEKYPKDYDSSENLIVYWVKNGSVWHESRKCSSLARSSSDIYSGSENEAKDSGKDRACKICSEND